MTEEKLIKKIKGDPRFNPFNDRFDYDYIHAVLKHCLDDYGSDIRTKIMSMPAYNQYYLELKRLSTKYIVANGLSKNSTLETIITLANRDFYLISQLTSDAYKINEDVDFDKMTNISFYSRIPEMGLINAQAGLEANHDGLNVILNQMKKNILYSGDQNVLFENIDGIFRLLGFSNIYSVTKSSYDTGVWENYDFSYNDIKRELLIKCPNNQNQEFHAIGQFRLERNLFSSKMVILQAFKEKSDFYKLISKESLKKRKPKRLKSVTLTKGVLTYKLANGIEKESVLKELINFADITTYYSFIRNETLPNFEKTNLYDVFLIYSEIQCLFERAHKIKKEEDTDPLISFEAYQLKIEKHNLINYVFLKTRYSRLQIKQIVELISDNNTYYNVWERPFIQSDQFLLPVLLPLLSPNTLRLTDFWLEKGGFDLDRRGTMFEKYIKSVIHNSVNKKGYFVRVIDEEIFRLDNGAFEEIDLLVELKNIILIGEVKCIKFPFSPRDFHNMNKRLSDGALQLDRKINFLNKNQKFFESKIDFTKKIVPVVVTNYPIFSGIRINQIPVFDISLLENYFVSGSLKRGKFSDDGKKTKLEEVGTTNFYYNNEEEMSNNLKAFLQKPFPVHEKIKDVYREETQITLPEVEPRIKMDYIKFRNPNIVS